MPSLLPYFAAMRFPALSVILVTLCTSSVPTLAQEGYAERSHWRSAWDTTYQRLLRDSLLLVDSDTARVDFLLRLSSAHKSGPKEPCFHYVDSALQLARRTGYRWGEGWALWQIAHLNQYYRFPEGPDTAMKALRLAYPIAQDLGEPLLLRKVEAQFALLYFNVFGEPDSAVAHIDRLFAVLGDTTGGNEFRSLRRVADLYRDKIATEAEASRVRTQHRWMLIAMVPLLLLAALWGFQHQRAHRLRAELNDLEKQQRLHAAQHMFEGEQLERARIARELHDGLGALLAAARAQLASIDAGIKALEGLDLKGKTDALLDNAYQEVRRIAHDMMPGALERFGLEKALGSLCTAATHEGFVASSRYQGPVSRLPKTVEVALYRIAQEALGNSLKHARATHFSIHTQVMEKRVIMACEDDGQGFDTALVRPGLGLESMRSRSRFLGGELTVESTPGRGTRITVNLPLHHAEPDAPADRG